MFLWFNGKLVQNFTHYVSFPHSDCVSNKVMTSRTEGKMMP